MARHLLRLRPMDSPASYDLSEREPRAVKILAKSIYRELKAAGYSRADMVRFTNELLDFVAEDIRGQGRTS